MRRRTRWMSLQILCLLVSGFITNAGAETAFNKARGGLRFQEIAIGQGPTAQTGDVVTMHFTGWLQERESAVLRYSTRGHRVGQYASSSARTA